MSEYFNFNKLFDICSCIFSFFILNLFFIILNLPIIIFILSVGISKIFYFFPLFLVCLIPVLPTFNILLFCMNKFFKNKSFNLLKDIKKGFLLNTRQSLFIWIIELTFIFILYSNIMFFKMILNQTVISCLFITLLILIILMTPYISLLISLFSNNSLSVLKNSLILVFKKPMLTITNILILIFALMLFEISPAITFLFISSITAYLFIFANKKLIEELELLSITSIEN